jgi:hypothetical protein
MNLRVTALACAVLTLAFTIAPAHEALADPISGNVADTATAAGVPFPDVPQNSWAYDAIRQLAADGYLAGYPDGTFKGDRPMSRYEVSYLINKIVNAMKDQIANGKTPPPDDVALINKLAASVSSDLKDLSGRVDAMKKEEAALKTEADVSRDNLRGMQIKMNIFQRPGTFEQNVSGFNGPTALLHGAVAANGALPSGWGPAPLGNGLLGATSQGTSLGQNALQTGNYTHGTNWQETRLVFTGQPSDNLTYYIRLENKYEFSAPNYQSFSSPAACTSTVAATLPGYNACTSQLYVNGNTPLRLNQSYIMYATPAGYFLKFGRWQEDEGTASSLGLGLGGNYTNGVQVGLRNNRFAGYAAYGYALTALSDQALNNTNCPLTLAPGTPVCANQTQQLIMGMASYDLTSKTNIGATWDDSIGNGFALWNPAAGLCSGSAVTTLNTRVACPAGSTLISTAAGPVTGAYQTATTGLSTLTGNATQFIGKKMKITGEFAHRFGTDPFTGSAWQGSNAYGAQFDYASGGITRPGPLYPGLGVKNSNVFEVAWVASGFNGLSPEAGPAGTTPYQSFYYNSLNGFQWSWVTYQHWWSSTFRTGIVYHHFSTLPGQDQPAGSATCPGCYIKVSANALFLESYLQM